MSPGSRLNRAQAVPPMPALNASAAGAIAASAAAAAANPLAVNTGAQAQAPSTNLLVRSSGENY